MKFVPKWMAWEITRRCNLHCVHCRSASGTENKGHPDFPTSEAFRIIDEITSFAKPVLVLSGGEPLLREDVFEIAEYGTRQGLRMCLATNGTLVDDQVCQHVRDAGIRIVSLSLDGADARTHDSFRNQDGSFDSVVRAARLFKEHGIDFIINSSFTQRNQDQIPTVYELAKNLGATAWYMFMIVPTGRGKRIMNELIPDDDYEKFLNWHYEMERDEESMLVRPTCAPHYYRILLQRARKEEGKFERRKLKFSTGGSKGCLAGQLICLIDVDGNVLPCSYLPLAAGNVHLQTFQEIWEGSELLENLRDVKKYRGKCGQCEYVKVCGGCRARAYSVSGDYLQEEPFCGHQPVRLERARR